MLFVSNIRFMYLSRLELQGFKTFANKIVFEFKPEKTGRRGLTGIVGPNGSGKSNVADAIRWVMGEQSLKLLRSKKSEDVIFSGSAKKARAGFAEVSLTLIGDDSESKSEGGINLSEVVITRRLYRDGQSEYEINRQVARLIDVTLLLAQCGMGQRTYSVIGQGMVDAVLSATPTERKEFFDEAAGLKPFQLKRQSAINKLQATKENLQQAELLLNEIGPRLTSLERQAKRLRERDRIESDLRLTEKIYYGGKWADLRRQMREIQTLNEAARHEKSEQAVKVAELESALSELEKSASPAKEFKEIRALLDALHEERSRLREEQIKLEASKEMALVRAEKTWAPLSLSKIIESVESLENLHLELQEMLTKSDPDLALIIKLAGRAHKTSRELLTRLQRPAPEEPKIPSVDLKLQKNLQDIADQMRSVQKRAKETETKLDEWNKGEEGQRSRIFDLQHKLTAKRHDEQEADRKAGEMAVSMARLETRRDSLLQDIRAHAPALESEIDRLADQSQEEEEIKKIGEIEALTSKLNKLRSQIEWIGGIDPEVLKEYEETKKRFEDLAVKSEDLKQALVSLDSIIAELDKTIKDRAATAFRLLNREFGRYFKILFQGGEAELIEVAPEFETAEEDNIIPEPNFDAPPVGIEIHATPPGKRMKSVALLSGGERALTSIALICAIMATNPSPFIVLDEVDAALDESNSIKYSEILQTLSDRTQFVVITHNRATMNTANVLYGVTMGDDGVSQILSVKLENETKKEGI